MKKHAMPEMKEGGVNVTPLIDIVMCLIIFFMLVAKIGVSRGDDANITPPATLLGVKIEDIGNTLTLNVKDPRPEIEETPDPCDRLTIGDRNEEQPLVTAMLRQGEAPREIKIIRRFAAGQPPDYELRRVLETAVKGDPVAGVPGNLNLKLIIKAEKCLEYRLLQQVLQAAAEAGVTNINFEMKRASILEAAEQDQPSEE